jgi:hypothetical protein
MAKRKRTNTDLQNTTQKTKDLQNTTQKTKDLQNTTQKTKDLQNTTQKTKDRATRTPLKTGSEFMCSGRVNSFMVLKLPVFMR